MYELTNADGIAILPEHANFKAPNETQLASFVNFTNIVGQQYTLETNARSTLDVSSHRSYSSNKYLRRSECLKVAVEGSFVVESLDSFKTPLKTVFEAVDGIDCSEVVMGGFEEAFIGG